MYSIENTMPKAESEEAKSIDFFDKAALFIVIAIFAVIAVGSMANNWSANDISAVMLTGTVLLGFTMRYKLSKIFSLIVEGVKELTGMYLVIILANTVGIILKNGNILDTIIYRISEYLQCLPKLIIPTGIMVFICIMNVILPSGAGKAVMLMPIISPIGQAYGDERTVTSVLGYKSSGDGFFKLDHPARLLDNKPFERSRCSVHDMAQIHGETFCDMVYFGCGNINNALLHRLWPVLTRYIDLNGLYIKNRKGDINERRNSKTKRRTFAAL